MNWFRSWRADPAVRVLADRHYSRRTVGAAQFSPPGRNLTLRTFDGDAGWVTCWPKPEYVDHDFGDCWTCTLFRNEGSILSSDLITEAVAATAAYFGDAPSGGFLTFVNGAAVESPNPGYCFQRAGFQRVGETKHNRLTVLRLAVDDFPGPLAADEFQQSLAVAA